MLLVGNSAVAHSISAKPILKENWERRKQKRAESSRAFRVMPVVGTVPNAPCMIDFLPYRIGRQYCSEKLVEFACERGHRFYYFGAKLKLCPDCRGTLTLIRRLIPCQVDKKLLPRDEAGILRLDESNLLRTFDGLCIFESACSPKANTFRKYSPPKSISIIGRTGWTDSYANKEEGGGGMMG